MTNKNLYFYHQLYLIRRVEEEIERLYPSDVIKSPVHLSIGQEHIAVGVCSALLQHDIIFSNYRGHAHYLARGGNLQSFWAELYGKKTGFARGKAGSMHLMDLERGFMQASAVVATGIPNAAGYALAHKMQQRDGLVICFHGEGAVNEGVWSETMNFSALHQLPILYICENNQYAIYSHQSARAKQCNVTEISTAYGVESIQLQNNTCQQIYFETNKACNKIRAGHGPILLEIPTMRWRDHVGPGDDTQWNYRSAQALEDNIANDHLQSIGAQLKAKERLEVETKIEHAIKQAITYAQNSEFPNENELSDYVEV